MRQIFEVRMMVQVAGDSPVTWEDVEWAVRDLFYDDEEGNPNFTIGAMTSIIAEEVRREE